MTGIDVLVVVVGACIGANTVAEAGAGAETGAETGAGVGVGAGTALDGVLNDGVAGVDVRIEEEGNGIKSGAEDDDLDRVACICGI